MGVERIILQDDFERSPDGAMPDGWWAEGGERVWVEGGRLRVKADPADPKGAGNACTVWHKQPFGGNVRVTFDAHVVGSSCDANNINLFLFYSDLAGRPLFDSRAERASGGYDLYHNLNGYIVTFLNDTEQSPPRARLRLRRCPGFQRVSETFGYECRRGVTYHIDLTRQSGRLIYSVDDRPLLDWTDPAPLVAGHFGFRTWRTDLWFKDLRIVQPS